MAYFAVVSALTEIGPKAAAASRSPTTHAATRSAFETALDAAKPESSHHVQASKATTDSKPAAKSAKPEPRRPEADAAPPPPVTPLHVPTPPVAPKATADSSQAAPRGAKTASSATSSAAPRTPGAGSAATRSTAAAAKPEPADASATEETTGASTAGTSPNAAAQTASADDAPDQDPDTQQDPTAEPTPTDPSTVPVLEIAAGALSTKLVSAVDVGATAEPAVTAATTTETRQTAPLLPGLAVTSGGAPGEPTAASTQAPNATPAPTPAAPVVQVALAVSRHVTADGDQNFTLQLRPERLGSVEVELKFDQSGQATATFRADRPETLQLLRQDAHHLIQALGDVGVPVDSSALSFALNEHGSGANGRTGDGEAGSPARTFWGRADDAATEAATSAPRPASSRLYDLHA